MPPDATAWGRRARRKLGFAAIAAMIIVGAAIMAVALPGRSSRSGSHNQSSKEVFGTFGAFGVAYGTHGTQLLARFGAPDQKRNGCWIYRIHGTTFRGIKLIPQIVGMDAVRYCFFSGVVATIEDHWRPGMQKSPEPGPWTAPVTYGCGGKSCQRLSPP